ncbi:MAG: XTP/dITP diphosphatase [Chlorobi bacterium]|nr:XTP/dITP diphosphatase [Chlorobiota bacterium]MCI0716061.1 XTP/dITP diphosphatase [Chlorobiota bacterium]
MISKIFIASRNKGKIKEIKNYLDGLDISFSSLLDTPRIENIEETGKTFEENALIKGRSVYNEVKIPVLADDSGLEVDCLKGEPGILSARYAGKNSDDKKNCEKLLKNLEEVTGAGRSAKFKCILVYLDEGGPKYFEGVCKGIIIEETRGQNGFGYDPIFVPDGFSKTFAELDFETKSRISHRGIALKKLREYLTANN